MSDTLYMDFEYDSLQGAIVWLSIITISGYHDYSVEYENHPHNTVDSFMRHVSSFSPSTFVSFTNKSDTAKYGLIFRKKIFTHITLPFFLFTLFGNVV